MPFDCLAPPPPPDLAEALRVRAILAGWGPRTIRPPGRRRLGAALRASLASLCAML